MERSDVVALAYHFLDCVVYDYALGEFFSSVHHAVAHGVDFAVALDAAFGFVGELAQHGFDGSFVVGEAEFHDVFAAVGAFVFQESVGKADFFHSAFGEHFLAVGVDEFVFYRAAARVQNKYFHGCQAFSLRPMA